MKKFILTFIIIAIHVMLFGQEYNTTIGVKLMPGLTTIYGNHNYNGNWSPFSKNGGIVVDQRIFKDMLFIETGLFCFEKGIGVKTTYTDQFGNPTGTHNGKDMNYFLTVPVSLIYKLKGFYVGAGINVNYYFARRWILDRKLIHTELLDYIDNITFGAQFSLGYELKLPKRFLMSFEAYANPTFKVRYLNYGIGIGLKYIICKPKV